MAITRYGVCNQALGWCSSPAIQSFDDGTTEADLCKRFYESNYRLVLEGHPWNFAEKATQPLSALSATPADEYDFQYNLPSDFIAFRSFLTSNKQKPRGFHKIRNNRFLTDEEDPIVIYTYRAPEQFAPNYFGRLVALKLAADLAGPLTENSAMIDRFEAQYSNEWSRATFTDSRQDSGGVIEHFPLIDAHRGI